MKELFVNGTLMRGLSLHHNLEGAEFLGVFRTAPLYRLYSINDVHPGMFEVGAKERNGVSVTGELYRLDDMIWARVKSGEPDHLYCGPVFLEDGRVVEGMLYPRHLAEEMHEDISNYGDWRTYLAAKEQKSPENRPVEPGPRNVEQKDTDMDRHTFSAEPYALGFEPAHTALLMIDMQRDFMEPGGFGAFLGNDVSLLRNAIKPAKNILEAARGAGLLIVHTREGHAPDLADLPPTKKARGNLATGIGDMGPMGRILVRGEPGHDIIPEVYPLPGEPIVDKPGKGAFFATDLDLILRNREIRTLIVCGVTTEVCVNTTVREANDRGYECVVAADATGSYFPEFQRVGLEMIKAQGGIFGWVTQSAAIIEALNKDSL